MQIGRARESWQIHKHIHRFFDQPNHTFFFRLTNRSEHVVRKPSNFTMEIPTEAKNAESKVEEFPVAMFITTSSRRPVVQVAQLQCQWKDIRCEHKWFKLYAGVAV